MINRIVVLGDSTLQFNDYQKYPQTGWPQALPRFLKWGISILNFAKNGRSTKSFILEGRLDEAIQMIQQGDLVIIQFGHNDSKDDPNRYTHPFGEYQSNLKEMICKVKNVGGAPILLTSIAERVFLDNKIVNTHGEYPKAMQEVALQEDVPCIDMFTLTKEKLEIAGVEGSKKFFMNFKADEYETHPLQSQDNTHLRYDGAYMVAMCFVEEMKRQKLYLEIFR